MTLRSTIVLLLLVVSWSSADALLNNTVTQWINETRALARSQKLTNHLAITQYVYVSVASYRALQAGGANENALAAFAAHTVNAVRYPVIQQSFDRLLKAQLRGIPQEEVDKAQSIALPIAYATLEERIGDPATFWKDYTPTAPGTRYGYQFLTNQTFSLAPQLTDSQPFVWPADKLRAFSSNKDPKAGPVFEPPKTHDDLVAVVDAGAKDSKTRSKYDTDTASFWALGSGVGGGSNSISGAFLDIAQKVLSPTLSLKQTALEFARISTAMYDAYVACWQVKYRTNYWRPTTAIQQGWPGFTAIPDWQPLLPVPPFPEYPSGHQCTAGAALRVLQKALGKDQVTFTIQSDERPDIGFRTYNSLEAAGQEASKSRLFAGLHFPSANEDGQKLGKLVGEYVYDNFLTSPAAKVPQAAAQAYKPGVTQLIAKRNSALDKSRSGKQAAASVSSSASGRRLARH